MVKPAPLTLTAQKTIFSQGGAGLTIEKIIEKYDGVIRKTIAGRCDSDVFEDRYQDTILNIMKYLDTINAHPNPMAYIITVAKHCARPNNKANRKMITYGGWTNDDGEDNTEEWLLEDDTHNPEKVLERRAELKQRKRAEDWATINAKLQKPPRLHNRPVHIKKMDSSVFYHNDARQPIRDATRNLKELLKSVNMSLKDCGYNFRKTMGLFNYSYSRTMFNALVVQPALSQNRYLKQIKTTKRVKDEKRKRKQLGGIKCPYV
ncbi:MAG: sigma-70 family RNA polymerase sigma factor [Alphaproteobacteria bacterium]|nr:sigma-70 family RNA polymerase sigma factor [Alphaproteobacteria bacterium]